MAFLPDLGSLRLAADVIDRTAATVEADAASVNGLVEGLPWRGPRRQLVAAGIGAAVGLARGQAAAERELARALRQLALEVERELQVLAGLAARALDHLQQLLRQAQALVAATAEAVAAAAAAAGARLLLEVASVDPAGALREARQLAEEAVERLRRVTLRLHSLPAPSDPVWRRLGPEILAWRPG